MAVCTQPANTNTQPCSPLATLATSTSTTSGGANPLTTDSNGNFFFYAVPGRYTVQVYGPQVGTPFVQPDTSVPGDGIFIAGCQHANNSQTITAAITAAGTGGCVVVDPGTYAQGSTTLTIPTGVTVHVSAGASITSSATPAIRINNSQSGLVCDPGDTAIITNSGTGDTILIQGSSAVIADVDVTDCRIVGFDTAARGIVALRGTKINIRGNHIVQHKSDGIVVDGDGVGGATQNLIQLNRITASGAVLANKAGIRVGSTNVNTTTRVYDNYADNYAFGLSDAGTNTESIGNVWETPSVASVSIETGSTDFLSLHDWFEGFPAGHAANIHSNDRTRILYPHTVTALSDFTFDSLGASIDRFELKIQGQSWSGPTCFNPVGGNISTCPTASGAAAGFGGPIIAGGTGATLTGTGACSTITTQTGGSWAGSAKCTAATAASTLTITPGVTAPNGWVCSVYDETTRANLFQQTSHTQTTCVLTVTSVTQNDVFVFSAMAF